MVSGRTISLAEAVKLFQTIEKSDSRFDIQNCNCLLDGLCKTGERLQRLLFIPERLQVEKARDLFLEARDLFLEMENNEPGAVFCNATTQDKRILQFFTQGCILRSAA